MMANQSFGGPWTERKLKCLRDYLNAYRTIFTGNPKARYFRTWYVDAFAGTGSRATATDNTPAPLLDIYENKEWCAARDWSKERAVVFLDPYGMQVEWSTVQTLAATKGVDLWYLFPGIARLLRHDGKIDEKWGARLDILLGTDAWRTRFFQKET